MTKPGNHCRFRTPFDTDAFSASDGATANRGGMLSHSSSDRAREGLEARRKAQKTKYLELEGQNVLGLFLLTPNPGLDALFRIRLSAALDFQSLSRGGNLLTRSPQSFRECFASALFDHGPRRTQALHSTR